MLDIDGSSSSKALWISMETRPVVDGMGMVRVETGANGANGVAANSYVEFAISWSYLQNSSNTGLGAGQSWAVGAASIYQANDHNTPYPNGDILGAALGDVVYTGSGNGWGLSDITPVPEPVNVALGLFGMIALGGAAGRRCLATRKTKNA